MRPNLEKQVGIVAFDLDGTLAESTWPLPHIGAPIREGVDSLLSFFQEGYAIYIHTARPRSHEALIRSWLQANGLANAVYHIVTDKPLADLYIDDRAWRPPWADRRPQEETASSLEPEPDQEPMDPREWTVMG